MNPQQLLEETEKAIGDAELYRLHADLIAKRKQYNEDKQVGTRGRVRAMCCRPDGLLACLEYSVHSAGYERTVQLYGTMCTTRGTCVCHIAAHMHGGCILLSHSAHPLSRGIFPTLPPCLPQIFIRSASHAAEFKTAGKYCTAPKGNVKPSMMSCSRRNSQGPYLLPFTPTYPHTYKPPGALQSSATYPPACLHVHARFASRAAAVARQQRQADAPTQG
eukprot:360465-Chlamydomonas_euryale.AAC.2